MSEEALKINGWEVYAHPLFLDQLEKLIAAVDRARKKDPKGYRKKRAAKLLSAVLKVAFEVIPEYPTRPAYRQGDTLGEEHTHWFRAKFLQQYRLFFRYHETDARNVVVLAWVNDESTLRAYGSGSDAYAMFRRMLAKGNPPSSWDALLKTASQEAAQARLKRARPSVAK